MRLVTNLSYHIAFKVLPVLLGKGIELVGLFHQIVQEGIGISFSSLLALFIKLCLLHFCQAAMLLVGLQGKVLLLFLQRFILLDIRIRFLKEGSLVGEVLLDLASELLGLLFS